MSVPDSIERPENEPAIPPSPENRSQPKPAPPASTVGRRIEYLQSFRFVFAQQDWFKSLLIFSLFVLIPVLQTPLIFGYAFAITEHLHRRLTGAYPLFEIRKFAAYITRGIWCYLITNIVGAVLAPIIQVIMQGGMFGTMAAIQADETIGTIVVAVVVPLVIIGFIVFLFALGVALTPLYLRAGLTQDFALTFNFRWIGDFIRRMWLESVLINLFVFVSSLIVVLLGCLVFCYGAIVAAAYMSLVGAHLNWQLYELYLARGGEPIPLKPLPADVPPVVVGHPTSPNSSASP